MSQSALKLVGREEGDKARALEAALAQIDRAFGKGSVMKLGSKSKIEVEAVSTGSLGLDIALGIGGLPKGRVVEIYGPESSGKTTLALHVVAEVQKNGGTAAFVDAEHALDPSYTRKLGVNLDDRKIDFVMVEEPLQATGKNAKEMARKQAEIKKEKAKSAQRHEKRKEGKDHGKPDKGGRAKPSNRRPSKNARDKAKSTK